MTRHNSRKALILALIVLAATGCAKYRAEKLGISEPLYKVRVEKNVMIPADDGTLLATDIYWPRGMDKGPAILVRTPYGKSMSGSSRESMVWLLAERGYVVLVQDVRGRFKSEGRFYPFVRDGADGQATMRWIEDQPWFDGNLGTHGGSYLGATQWLASPGMDIEAMHLTVTSPNLREVLYTGGELHLNTVYFWSVMMGDKKPSLATVFRLGNLGKYMETLPLSEADDRAGRDVEYFNQSLDLDEIWEVYEKVNFEDKYDDVGAPAVFVAGWYDMFLGPQLEDFAIIREEGKGKARESVLVVGPWGHGKGGDGSVDYGPHSLMKDVLGPGHTLAWFDHYLKGADNEVGQWPAVKIFVMGENVWRDESEWPLARTEYTPYYLHSGGGANTRSGDGTLSPEAPSGDEPEDGFVYDPLDPVPTLGGNNLGGNLGAYDQSAVEDRDDVLCYTTAPLERDLEVTGPITAVLYAASDAADTDFTVKLVDVYPGGKAINIQDGVVRAMYRNNDPADPTPLTPGAAEEYEIDLWATSNLFKKGHRIRVEVSSSNFPRFNRNLNTGEPPADATRAVKANQTIFHDAERPSRIILPVIPR